MAPLLKSVERAGIIGIRRKRNPASISSTDFFTESELLRLEFARLIGSSEPQRMAIIPSASYGLSTVARNINVSKGQHILVVAEQFPSNVYPWKRLAAERNGKLITVIPPDQLISRGRIWNEKILEAITAQTKVVSIGHVHWADGTRFDLAAIRKRLDEVDGLLIIDGTQSVGAMPFDFEEVRPDALICAGYKWLMGPYSIGMAYYGPAFDKGIPLEENWINRLNSEDFSGLVVYQDEYQPGAVRYDVGEHSNFVLVPMLLQSLRQLNHWKPAAIQDYCHRISKRAVEHLRSEGFWVEEESWRGHHLFGLRLPGRLGLEEVKRSLLKKIGRAHV